MNRILVPGRWRNTFGLWTLGMAAMLASAAIHGQSVRQVRLTEQEVACQPAGDWLHQFPAISQGNDEIAVLTEPDPESRTVSLQILRILGKGLRLEREFPLFTSKHVNWKECTEELEVDRRGSDIGSPDIITAANAHLSEKQFFTMFPLDSRSIHGVTAETLPSRPEEVISWGQYHISIDYQHSTIVARELQGVDDGVLVASKLDFGQVYFELQLPIKKESGRQITAESCMGTPVPLAIWTNRRTGPSDDEVFLLRIGYVSSGGCSFPGEWIVEVAER